MAEQRKLAQVREVGPEETACTYTAFCDLRKGLAVMSSVKVFTDWVNTRQRPEGYRLVAAFLPGMQEAVAVAGFRLVHQLSRGRSIYVDDLVTLPEHRSGGYARQLFDWLIEETRRLGCQQLDLDSGYQRHTAHRFYLNRGMVMNAHHFSVPVD